MNFLSRIHALEARLPKPKWNYPILIAIQHEDGLIECPEHSGRMISEAEYQAEVDAFPRLPHGLPGSLLIRVIAPRVDAWGPV